jgi:hypothetical protein
MEKNAKGKYIHLLVIIDGAAIGIKCRTGNMEIKKAVVEKISKGLFRKFQIAIINSRKNISEMTILYPK